MESPAPVSRFMNHNSKNRMFPGGSSSSLSTCKDVEVLEISPPSNLCPAKPRSSKNKEVLYREIIDLDMEEDSNDITLTDVVPKTSGKGKEPLQYSSVGLNDSFNADDYGFSLLEDDVLYDDCSILESPFDLMDNPTGVEVPFPWFPGSPRNKTKVPETSSSRAEPMPDAGNSSLMGHMHKQNLTTSRSRKRPGAQINEDNLDEMGRISSKKTQYNAGHKKTASASGTSLSLQSSQASWSHVSAKESSHSKIKRNHSPSGAMSANDGDYLTLNLPTTAPGGGMFMPMSSFPAFEPVLTPRGLPNDGAFRSAVDHVNYRNCASSSETSIPTSAESRNVDEILHKYASFKKFEVVQDFSDHQYHANGSAKQPPKNWAKKIQDEWKILEKDLPDTIFVRAYETRIDLLRAVIVGAEGTPYHDGLYFFDVFFPSSYPNVPPHVYYHSGGLRINPNLYNCGKVCLSLLNTWGGGYKEKWIPGTSTMLQVLVSIQGLILNAKPYFNEPGYASSNGSIEGEKRSLDYNESTFMLSLQTMVYNMRRPPKHFEDFAVGHFRKYARDILVSCKAYLDGAQVGCLVKGGVQDVDEGDKSCSKNFKSKLAAYSNVLVNAFLQVGAKDCEEFLFSLTLNGNGQASAPRRGRGARNKIK